MALGWGCVGFGGRAERFWEEEEGEGVGEEEEVSGGGRLRA